MSLGKDSGGQQIAVSPPLCRRTHGDRRYFRGEVRADFLKKMTRTDMICIFFFLM